MIIGQTELKQYIVSSRACSIIPNGISLDNDKSRVYLNFDQYQPEKSSVELLRGHGSDGRVIINGTEYILPPNKPRIIEISGFKVTVYRPAGSYGKIIVSSVTLNKESVQEDKIIMKCDWNTFLKRIGKIKGIKRTDVGVMVSECAEIPNGDEIIELHTDPPAAYKRINGKIVFIHPCRIYEVSMKGDIVPQKQEIPFIVKAIEDQENKVNNLEYKKPTPPDPAVVMKVQAPASPPPERQKEIYTSNILKASSITNAQDVVQIAEGVLVKFKGKFSIPMPLIKSNTSYIVSLRGKKTNGNGKVGVQLVDGGVVKSNMIIALGPSDKNIIVRLTSGERKDNMIPPHIVIYRPLNASSGDVIIKQIKVNETQDVARPLPVIKSETKPAITPKKIDTYSDFDTFNWGNITNSLLRPWPTITPCVVNTDYTDKIASILITSYDRPNLLRYGLSSINSQSFDKKAVEIIVLNDYLPDETEKVCQEFPDLNIRYVYTGQRNIQSVITRAPSYALNIGAKIAKGKYLFISCAEIYHIDNTIQNMINKLSEGKEFVTTCVGYEDSGKAIAALKEGRKFSLNNEIKMKGMHLPYFLGLHKDVYFEIGGYDEDFIGLAADDNDFADRLVKHGCKYQVINDRIIHLHHSRLLDDGTHLTKANNNRDNRLRLAYNRKLYDEKKEKIVRNESGWGDVRIVNRNNEWNFKNIPKIAHFYWGGDTMPFLRYLTIKSFVGQNPDWTAILHRPAVFGTIIPTWGSHEQKQSANTHKASINYYDEVEKLGVSVVQHNFKDYGIENNIHEVHKSDFLRWKLLAEQGGIWADMDIIFTRPMNYMPENIPLNANVNVGLCRYGDGAHAIGFLMSSANNNFFCQVFDKAKKCFNKGKYQSIGSTMMHRFFRDSRRIQSISPGTNVLFVNLSTVYSITNIGDFISNKNYIEDYPEAIGFHWYGGHPDTSKVEGSINQDNYMEFKNFLGKLALYTMGAK